MITVLMTDVFSAWLRKLSDRRARQLILVRAERFESGNPGDTKSVGGGVMELRIHHGPGYRVYYTYRQHEVVLLLVGGDKSSQQSDIEKAQSMAKELEGHHGN